MSLSISLIEEKDLDFIFNIRQEPEVQENLGTLLLSTKEDQLSWYKNLQQDKSKLYFRIEENNEGTLSYIGYVRLTEIDFINRSVCVGADIRKESRGMGYSDELYTLILDFVFNKLNMHRAWLFVLETNKRAIHIYEKNGFTKEGVQREAVYRGGKYINYIMMGQLKKEYNKKGEKKWKLKKDEN